jgi:CheY-like chemotaxis protein
LILDDNKKFLVAIGRIIKSAGHEYTLASNGVEGLRCYLAKPHDLVITDVLMPEMNGLEFMTQVLNSFPNAKVIVMSSADFLDSAAALGAADVIGKPFSPQSLLDKVEMNLGRELLPL